MAGSEETCTPTSQEEFQLCENVPESETGLYGTERLLFVNGYENKALLVFL